MKKNSAEVRDFLTKTKCVVRYVRDVYGFKKGVVIATARNRLAWCLVNMTDDSEIKHMYPWQLPVIQYLRSKGEYEIRKAIANGELPESQRVSKLYELDSTILNDIAYEKCIRDDNWVKMPLFNKEEGLRKVIGRLHSDAQSRIRLDPYGNLVNESGIEIPNDLDLVETIHHVLQRAESVLK